jgi:hypothetical protein
VNGCPLVAGLGAPVDVVAAEVWALLEGAVVIGEEGGTF